ncbi:hypothetical protein ES705_15166 [subsurface metagenome]|nr:hypothetical protein [Methanosarcinales archaeon]
MNEIPESEMSEIEDMDLDKLEEEWKENEKDAEEIAENWEKFFRAKEAPQKQPKNPGGEIEEAEMAKISEVIEKRELEIYKYPNVVGLGASYRTKAGKPTDELCLVVYVEKKVPAAQLSKRDIIPKEIDGVKTDVVEMGRIEAL